LRIQEEYCYLTSIMIWNIAATLLLLLNQVQGHGHMVEPKSRNYRAWTDGAEWSNNANVPKKEYTPQGLNNARGQMWSQCGIPQDIETVKPGYTRNYDSPLAANGQPLSWQSQATYQRGATITVKLAITVNHSPGYFEFYACPRNEPLTEACFKRNPLTFRGDRLYGNQRPIATSQAPSVGPFDRFYHNYHNYEYLMELPINLTGDVLIQWVWINTASGWGEKFWNCAEVTISGGNGNTGGGGGTCGNGNRGNGVCASGECCSQWGWCGTSSAHCSGSGSGTCGNGNRGNGVCANRQCCSQWGWCGTSSAHCSRERGLRGNETFVDN
jgi:predicted carbohydrate-binding protein with CBM5 and CBM33 domain